MRLVSLALIVLCLAGCVKPPGLLATSPEGVTVSATWANSQEDLDALAERACARYGKTATPAEGEPACADYACVAKGWRYDCI